MGLFKKKKCEHDFKGIARHEDWQKMLLKCDKCGVYCVYHSVRDSHFQTDKPGMFGEWVYFDQKGIRNE